ncbi:MAG: glycosyltransferase family 39 protein [Alphaproteobacteria bacterium]|nr:glycosyltransferase family 39 protein [Alphaproteobacteria bacterium]MDD9919693.1 glycosyltransferase family 39 protein [Alphaproteobacteria bacterium]
MARHKSYKSPEVVSNHTWQLFAFVLFTFLGVLYFWGHNRYQLFDVDEAIFTQATIEMVESNNYVLPTYNGEPRYHKPPLIYWLQAGSLKAFDAVPYKEEITPLAARLPSAICGLLAVLVFYLFTAALTQRQRYAVTATAIFSLNLLWLIVVRAAIADAALNLIMLTSTLYMLWLLYTERVGFLYQIIAGLLLALGFLAKGPIALAIPGAVVGLAVLVKPHFLTNIRVLNPIVILLALAIGFMPWMLMILQKSGLDFFKEFIWVHNIQRFFGGLNNTHSTSGFYYPIVFLIGFFPWSVLFICALPWAGKYFFETIRKLEAKYALPFWGLIWCLLVLVLFSFSQTKLVHYIVPALPGAALFIAGWLEQISLKRSRKALTWIGLPLALVFGGFFLVFNRLLVAARPETVDPMVDMLRKELSFQWPPAKPLVADILSQSVMLNQSALFIGILFIIGSFVGFGVLRKGFRHGTLVLVTAQLGILALIVVGIMPMVSNYTQKPLAQLAEHIKTETNGDTLYHLGLHHPSVRLISGIPFIEVSKPVQLEGVLNDKRTLILHEAHKEEAIREILPETATISSLCKGGFCVLTVDDRPEELRKEEETVEDGSGKE